ncbi:hypothetical protein V6N11_028645 [Hibiscus sabdariffa]|uniref:Uncharacterized protein n=1 Tax=Hibiscus sabdariffa TaxID=183260 RepID=A0ABR2PQG3_9ROSI
MIDRNRGSIVLTWIKMDVNKGTTVNFASSVFQCEEEEPSTFFPELNFAKKKKERQKELSRRSLFNLYLTARWDVLTREARNALELGNTIAMQIVGDEEEVIRDIALLDAN